MTKEELKALYKTHKITAQEYFQKLSLVIASEAPAMIKVEVDLNSIFDGGLPLYEIRRNY